MSNLLRFCSLARKRAVCTVVSIALLVLVISMGSPALLAHAAPVYSVSLRTSPAILMSRDDMQLLLLVTDQSGKPVNNALVRVYFQRDQSGHVHTDHNSKQTASWSAPLDAQPAGQPGSYQVQTSFPQSGKWFMRATVETPDGLSESTFVLRVSAASGTGDTNLGWIELGIVGATLLFTAVVTARYNETRRRSVLTAAASR